MVSLGVALYWRFVAKREYQSPDVLFITRLLPAVFSLLFLAVFFIPGFVWHEPRDTAETVSLLMLAITMIPALLFVLGASRGFASWRTTRRLVDHWRSSGEPINLGKTFTIAYSIDSDFPVVSLAGVLRTHLFMSRRVLRSCTPGEIAAVLAHEAAHRSSLDNFKRLLMRCCPDFLSLSSVADSIEGKWCEATEIAADDAATGSDMNARAELATALIKIARLAAGRSFPYATADATILRGGNITKRVYCLMNLPNSVPRPYLRATWLGLGMLLCLSLTLAVPDILQNLHHVTEAVVELFQ
jgi:hypothetical protein